MYLNKYSFLSLSNELVPVSTTDMEFAKGIAGLYASLAEGQEPLGREFEEIWDTHAEDLYES